MRLNLRFDSTVTDTHFQNFKSVKVFDLDYTQAIISDVFQYLANLIKSNLFANEVIEK